MVVTPYVKILADQGKASTVESVPLFRTHLFRPRRPSILRGIVLCAAALAGSLRVAGFPDTVHLHRSNWQAIPVLLAAASMVETARCIGRRWSFFHAGVLILLYSELMILAMAVFFLFCDV